jgi:hypothetical protein
VQGTATLDLSTDHVDFSAYETKTNPVQTLFLTNQGTMSLPFHFIRPSNDDLPFTLSRWEGRLDAGQCIDVLVTVNRNSLGPWEEEICLESTLSHLRQFFRISGVCKQAELHSAEFSTVDLGECAVGEVCQNSFEIKNYGSFPANYSIRASYPLRVTPKQGIIKENHSATFCVSWQPAGAAVLAGSLTLDTNCGMFYY